MTPKVQKFLLWFAPLSCGVLLLLCFAVGSICFLALRSHSPGVSSYPPPRTPYRGLTADVYGRQLYDRDLHISRGASVALRSLGKEGIPFLLEGLRRAQEQKDSQLESICLNAISPPLVETPDLAIFACYLSPSQPQDMRRFGASIYGKVGPRASFYLPAILAMRGSGNPQLEHVISLAAHQIDPSHYPDVGAIPSINQPLPQPLRGR